MRYTNWHIDNDIDSDTRMLRTSKQSHKITYWLRDNPFYEHNFINVFYTSVTMIILQFCLGYIEANKTWNTAMLNFSHWSVYGKLSQTSWSQSDRLIKRQYWLRDNPFYEYNFINVFLYQYVTMIILQFCIGYISANKTWNTAMLNF